MSKEICISTTPHETRLAILEDDELAEIYYERENEYTLAGSIYKGRVTRVLPGMQSAFVDIGLERDAFLYVTDFLEEQEDSEEFERTNLPGNQQRREGGRGRQPQPEQNAAPEAAAAPVREQESGEDESPSGTRRWRGRRGRGRGMRQRGGEQQERENRAPENRVQENRVQDQQVEAGSEDTRYDAPAPSAASATDNRLYESAAAFERHAPQPSAGRTVLPGESLSKYGGAPTADRAQPRSSDAQSAPASKANYFAPKPSTLIDSPLTWDGGSLLPGESRSRRSDSRTESRVNSEPSAHSAASVTEANPVEATDH
ncbi:MAG TPA: hypothetical protein VG345_00900, partial [Bryobacteraceae bacterium]|nr:hypothetical protein [Bryobacteraceae bacterium]